MMSTSRTLGGFACGIVAMLAAILPACGARTGLGADTGDVSIGEEAGTGDDTGTADDTGTGDDTGPTIGSPRPIAPLSTSRVTSRRPTLRWVLPDGVSGATVDLCLDRSCASPIDAPVFVSGTSYAPTADLPADVAIDATDVDDGIGTHSVYVYLGSSTGLASVPAVELRGGGNSGFGTSVASAGDVNGDGYADLIVGAPTASTAEDGSAGNAFVYLGGPDGLDSEPATKLYPSGNEDFGISVASAGDVNGDGYADVVVGADAYGRAYIYLGSAVGLAATPATILRGSPIVSGTSDGGFGSLVVNVGDVNGDGYADLIVGADEAPTSTSAALPALRRLPPSRSRVRVSGASAIRSRARETSTATATPTWWSARTTRRTTPVVPTSTSAAPPASPRHRPRR
jgi:hypothetical protein